jgi:hypothetical protein
VVVVVVVLMLTTVLMCAVQLLVYLISLGCMVAGCVFLLKHGKSEFRLRYGRPSLAAIPSLGPSDESPGTSPETRVSPRTSPEGPGDPGGVPALDAGALSKSDSYGANLSSGESSSGAGVATKKGKGTDGGSTLPAVVIRQTHPPMHSQPCSPPKNRNQQSAIRTPLLDAGTIGE